MSPSAACMDSPLGPLTLVADAEGLCEVRLGASEAAAWTPLLREVERQLEAWFRGDRSTFDLPLSLHGTPFQRAVWEVLLRIPFGATRTYGDVAHELGRPAAVRAVGAAIGRNPVAVIVPCHRVVGADGGLTGYAGGLAAKRWLLVHEASDTRPLGQGRLPF